MDVWYEDDVLKVVSQFISSFWLLVIACADQREELAIGDAFRSHRIHMSLSYLS